MQRVIYTLTVKDLDAISFSGAGAIKIYSLETNDFSVDLSGAGSIEIDELKADKSLNQPQQRWRGCDRRHCENPGCEPERLGQL